MDHFKLAALVLGLACCISAMTYERPHPSPHEAAEVRAIMREPVNRPEAVPAVAEHGRISPVTQRVF